MPVRKHRSHNALSRSASHIQNAVINFGVTQNSILSNVVIATHDTLLAGNLFLTKGSQFTRPENGPASVTLRLGYSYSLPVKLLKSRFTIDLNASGNAAPTRTNGSLNTQVNKDASVSLSLNSTASEQLDFSLSALSGVTSTGYLNHGSTAVTFSETGIGTARVELRHGFIFTNTLTLQMFAGLSEGYNPCIVVWNASIGKKMFKKQCPGCSCGYIINLKYSVGHWMKELFFRCSPAARRGIYSAST